MMLPHNSTPEEFLGPLGFMVCGLPGKKRLEHVFLMLVAYVDDSGSEGKGKCCFLAGFIGRAEAWHSFSDDWNSALKESPSIDYFKSKEANRRRDQFDGFSPEQRDAKVNRLAAVIGAHKQDLHAVASVLWWEDFKDFSKLFETPFEPYFILFSNVIWAAMQVVRRSFPGEKIEMVFDDQGTLGTRAAALSDWATESLSAQWRSVLHGRPVHRNDKITLPLQAADMLAWNLRRGCDLGTGFSKFPEAFEGIPLACRQVDKQSLLSMATNALEIQRRFPEIRTIYKPDELKAVRNAFLGYDPENLPK